MGIIRDAQGQLTPQSVIGSGRNSNSFETLCFVLVTCKNEENPIKNKGARVATRFSPNITLWEISVAMETRVLIRSGPKPNAVFPPSNDCDRPTGL